MLAIDDHADSAELVARVAGRCGYVAEHSADSTAIPRLLEAHSPDILSIDLCMPDLDGIELFKVLRNVGFDGSVILVSGQRDELRKSAEKLAGVHGIRVVGNLQKPVDIGQLRELLLRLRQACA